MVAAAGSLEATFIDLVTSLALPLIFKVTLILAVSPDAISVLEIGAVVQPHPGFTSVMTNFSVPEFLITIVPFSGLSAGFTVPQL